MAPRYSQPSLREAVAELDGVPAVLGRARGGPRRRAGGGRATLPVFGASRTMATSHTTCALPSASPAARAADDAASAGAGDPARLERDRVGDAVARVVVRDAGEREARHVGLRAGEQGVGRGDAVAAAEVDRERRRARSRGAATRCSLPLAPTRVGALGQLAQPRHHEAVEAGQRAAVRALERVAVGRLAGEDDAVADGHGGRRRHERCGGAAAAGTAAMAGADGRGPAAPRRFRGRRGCHGRGRERRRPARSARAGRPPAAARRCPR